MGSLLVRPHAPDPTGCVLDVTPQSAGWSHVGFKVHELGPDVVLSGGEAGREVCLVILSGTADVAVGAQRFTRIGGRTSVFEDAAPAAVYAPGGASWTVTAHGAVELAVCSAPASPDGQARLIEPAKMSREVRGQGTNTRYVRNILPQTEPAQSLLVVEVITPGGNWSSYPPHKHDTATASEETALEETYYHRLNPPQGFAFQRVYTDDRSLDETMAVEDGDVVMVPRGYHPVGAPHGYDLYYLNVMAGPKREWIFRNDPAHDWIARKV
ncbi:MAG: 5-deoxy-glucuronate isomerase [Pseudomonadota bacterium]|uniref:5-deoxy-glucuronate isomerase n=1 Tax=unclassified Phenylobacterium TaxID=2640670 RepID=UPI0007002B71|nr:MULTISPECIES: 5-deoxy-glucuronate isomerase [unclassified Phenylobacterium]KRB52882.1 5-deoxy-glucuronate isomerase [Phenylobacterium sp. Root700]MBT9471066.1 5-deoxy-glucuronate isomerase [Phenylobacterium sp.]